MTADIPDLLSAVQFCRDQVRDLTGDAATFADAHIEFQHRHLVLRPTDQKIMQVPMMRPMDEMARSADIVAVLNVDIDPDFARRTGQILNELRVQLDYLANIRGRMNGANDPLASFPVMNVAGPLSLDARKKVKQLSSGDQQRITDLQPLNCADTQALEMLHQIDIFRKHRAPLAFAATAGSGLRGPGRLGRMLTTGDEALLQRAGDERRCVNYQDSTMKIATRAYLAIFEPEQYRGRIVGDLLSKTADAVEYAIRTFENAPL